MQGRCRGNAHRAPNVIRRDGQVRYVASVVSMRVWAVNNIHMKVDTMAVVSCPSVTYRRRGRLDPEADHRREAQGSYGPNAGVSKSSHASVAVVVPPADPARRRGRWAAPISVACAGLRSPCSDSPGSCCECPNRPAQLGSWATSRSASSSPSLGVKAVSPIVIRYPGPPQGRYHPPSSCPV